MSEQQVSNPVQGMHCKVDDVSSKCTISMHMVCVTQYEEVRLLSVSDRDIEDAFARVARYLSPDSGANMSKEVYVQDFKDLVSAVSKVQKSVMTLMSGNRITTYAVGEPVGDEKGFLYLNPQMKEWWEHPTLEPIVQSIQQYLPDFSPWHLGKDKYLVLMKRIVPRL